MTNIKQGGEVTTKTIKIIYNIGAEKAYQKYSQIMFWRTLAITEILCNQIRTRIKIKSQKYNFEREREYS